MPCLYVLTYKLFFHTKFVDILCSISTQNFICLQWRINYHQNRKMNISHTGVMLVLYLFFLDLTITISRPNTSKKKNGVNYHVSEALLNPLLIQDPTRSSISHFHPRNLHGHQWYHQQQNIKNYKGVMASSSFMFHENTPNGQGVIMVGRQIYKKPILFYEKGKQAKNMSLYLCFWNGSWLNELNFKLIKVSLSVYYCIQICFIIWYQQLRNSFTKCGYKRNSRA